MNHRSVWSFDLAVSTDVREDVSVSVENQSQLAEVRVLERKKERFSSRFDASSKETILTAVKSSMVCKACPRRR